ncbi:squalene/phytoene synthase family protein [Sulfitobacter sp. PS-8MA]|uniref:squalene/phytoene synthase family protein n=1 Tax=Sulfitobacter sp. PS-8MA TaxID=3237707 RepID=UPI0034C5FD69
MSFDADLTACAAMVERADPWRFRAAMAAPLETRKLLFPLYAFNVEVARAPWVTQETMIAEMRLQWWRDALEEIAEGKPVRRHEVTTPLARAITPDDARLLDELVAARRWDIYKDPFEDEAHFERYIDQTAGHLMWVAARRLGAEDETTVRNAAYATGIAAWLCAIPTLEEAGRVPLLDGTSKAVSTLAQGALARLRAARANRGNIPSEAQAALLPAAHAGPVLKAAIAHPGKVSEAALPDPRRHFALRALVSRW